MDRITQDSVGFSNLMHELEERCSTRVTREKKGFVIKLPSSKRINQEWFRWKLNGNANL